MCRMGAQAGDLTGMGKGDEGDRAVRKAEGVRLAIMADVGSIAGKAWFRTQVARKPEER